MPDDKRVDREEDEVGEEPKPDQPRKKDLKDLDISDEAGGALKGGIPKQPDTGGDY